MSNTTPAAPAAAAKAAPKPAAKAGKPKRGERFTIRANRKRGFHRAGRFWPAGGETVARDDFTDEQWAALEGESMLTVTPAKDAAAGDQE